MLEVWWPHDTATRRCPLVSVLDLCVLHWKIEEDGQMGGLLLFYGVDVRAGGPVIRLYRMIDPSS